MLLPSNAEDTYFLETQGNVAFGTALLMVFAR
jgi:hypothetical protein